MSYFNYVADYFWDGNPNTKDIEVICACNVTYAKIKISSTFWGNELRADVNNSISCSKTCGNPWPIPAPTGYSCSDPVPTSSNKGLATCEMAPLTNTKRYQVVLNTINVLDLG